MRILKRYIAKQIIVGFLLISMSLLAMLWLTQSLRFVEMVTRQGLPVYMFVQMTSLLMPRIFNILSPIALFVAVLFVYNRMITDRELVVMQSSGISPWKSAQATIVVGLLLSFFGIYVMNFCIPQAEQKFRALEWSVKNNLTQAVFREGEFTPLNETITVFIDKHESDGSVSGIFVSDESKPGIKITLTAEKGRMVQTPKGPRILFINGVRQEINKKTFKFNMLSFTRYTADFNSGSGIKRKAQAAREKTFMQLIHASEDKTLAPQDVRKYVVEGHRRILYPFLNIILGLIACTGLLISNFNRRGQIKIISIEIVCMILIVGNDLALTNLAGRSLYFVPALYANYFIPLLVCLYLLIFYNPFYFYRHGKTKELKYAEK